VTAVDSAARKMSEAGGPQSTTAAVVLFAHSTNIKWLRVLKPGFRHCFVAVALAGSWVIMDPLSHKTSLTLVEGFSAEELVLWYEGHGLEAVRTIVRDVPARMAPLGPATCVEAVKRVLGIHARLVVTPRQLYDFLVRDKHKYLDIGEQA
jgi:hypothetical protein